MRTEQPSRRDSRASRRNGTLDAGSATDPAHRVGTLPGNAPDYGVTMLVPSEARRRI
ncbi:hypothetical protein JCM16408A_47970 [Methylobacterium phyllosphaerae]|jgi:hypothetical protein|uniref:Protein of unassigned function n=1 Tax=Methylobacterium oryzae CBMB20 TaxID=693986 RepID=A0A089NXN4_9HYPH|nr:protein of unassigned function [Methylobacterium oryzae CBMB20]